VTAPYPDVVFPFTFSFDHFLAGAGTTTLPIRILSSLRFGVSPAINATAAMILARTLGAVVHAYVILRRTGSGRPSAVVPGV
jgi:ABC-type spermidine/putrescine transport system permease subunit II